MTPASLRKAIDAAHHFVTAGHAAMVALARDDVSNKETAAAKRASMDLTRALAEMRKPG